MEETIHQTLYGVVFPSLVSAVGALAVYALSLGSQWLRSRVKDERVNGAIDQLTTLAENAVLEQEQIWVKKLKAENKWGSVEAKRTKEKTREVVLRHLGPDGLKRVQKDLGHTRRNGDMVVRGLVDTLIEAEVTKLRS